MGSRTFLQFLSLSLSLSLCFPSTIFVRLERLFGHQGTQHQNGQQERENELENGRNISTFVLNFTSCGVAAAQLSSDGQTEQSQLSRLLALNVPTVELVP